MNKLSQRKIYEKLKSLNEYILYLNQLKKEIKNEKQFLKDFRYFTSAERCLQLCCQIIIDCLDLIIIEQGLEKPEDRREIVSIIYNAGIISENLASKLEDIAGFRNILVHEYGKIDREKVYKYLKERADDFQLFKKEILKWLKSKN